MRAGVRDAEQNELTLTRTERSLMYRKTARLKGRAGIADAEDTAMATRTQVLEPF